MVALEKSDVHNGTPPRSESESGLKSMTGWGNSTFVFQERDVQELLTGLFRKKGNLSREEGGKSTKDLRLC